MIVIDKSLSLKIIIYKEPHAQKNIYSYTFRAIHSFAIEMKIPIAPLAETK